MNYSLKALENVKQFVNDKLFTIRYDPIFILVIGASTQCYEDMTQFIKTLTDNNYGKWLWIFINLHKHVITRMAYISNHAVTSTKNNSAKQVNY